MLKRAVVVVFVTSLAMVTPSRPAGAAETLPLTVETVVSGLTFPWDIAFLPDGTMFFTQRPGGIFVRLPSGEVRTLAADLSDFWASNETGMLSIEVDPLFATNRRLYTCQGTTDHDFTIQVVAWEVDAGLTSLTRTSDPLVGGIDSEFGKHGGCQLKVLPDGALYVSTGDGTFGTNPQNKFSLAGKVLRVDRFTGEGLPGNPFIGGGGDPRVLTYGHRNVQGLAFRHGFNQIFSIEHGTNRDDEINLLVGGGNYGWDPVPLPYNENVPMTFEGAIPATWSSGFPTIAPSAGTFLQGLQWGPWQGALAVSTLKGASLRLFFFDAAGNVIDTFIPPELDHTVGRLKGAELGPDGNLYLTTDNGPGGDKVLKVSPATGSLVLLRGTATPGPADTAFRYGIASYQHLLCNFDDVSGDGIAIYDRGIWAIRSTASSGAAEQVFAYGAPGFLPVCGDWDGDGVDGIGVYVNGLWLLRQTATPGPPDVLFAYGAPGYMPVVGDWDGAPGDGIGVYVNGQWLLRDTPTPGNPQILFAYGAPGYVPLVGDWDGAPGDGIGVYVGGQWFLRETPSPGNPQIIYAYGAAGYRPLVGDHDGNGRDGSGVVLPDA